MARLAQVAGGDEAGMNGKRQECGANTTATDQLCRKHLPREPGAGKRVLRDHAPRLKELETSGKLGTFSCSSRLRWIHLRARTTAAHASGEHTPIVHELQQIPDTITHELDRDFAGRTTESLACNVWPNGAVGLAHGLTVVEICFWRIVGVTSTSSRTTSPIAGRCSA